MTNKPDPRCNGCEFQHPFAYNMQLDDLKEKVYCRRGINPPYYKDGKRIEYIPSLMICHHLTYVQPPYHYAPVGTKRGTVNIFEDVT